MTTYTWPETRPHQPQAVTLRVIDRTQRSQESSLSGYVQTQAMPGARWGWSFDMPAQTTDDRQALEGYLLRLGGRQHRVQLWDLKRPRPLGTIALTGITLGATAAQFATSLVLAGCRAASNLVLGSSFETDANVDGLADGWTLFIGGAGDGGRTHTLSRVPTIAAVHGSATQFVQISAATNGNDTGITTPAIPVLPSTTYTASAYIRSGTTATYLLVRVTRGGGTDDYTVNVTAGASSAMLRVTVTFTTSASATSALLSVRGITAVSDYFEVDAVQIEPAAAATAYTGPATVKAGDWLGLAGGQLVMAAADATADAAGAMTVEVRQMLRASNASGGAVTLDKPTALYVRTEADLSSPRQPGGWEPPLSLDFVEVFA